MGSIGIAELLTILLVLLVPLAGFAVIAAIVMVVLKRSRVSAELPLRKFLFCGETAQAQAKVCTSCGKALTMSNAQ
jgi:hypothetical protein